MIASTPYFALSPYLCRAAGGVLCQRLGISQAELSTYVRDGKLRVFPDGVKKMFRVDQVDELAGGDTVSLAEAEIRQAKPAAGDGAGVTRGLVQASASGLLVAREILARG